MEENTPIQTTPAPSQGNKWLKPLLVIVVIIVAIAGYAMVHRWQQMRTIKGVMNDLGINSAQMEKSLADYSQQMAEEIAKQEAEAKKTPADKFNDAEEFEVTDHGKEKLVEDVSSIVKSVFDDTKVTGFTEGYMGMDSGSGVVQFMTPNLLETAKANDLVKKLQEEGYTVANTAIDETTAVVSATKDSVEYTFTFNKGDQSITAIILNKK